MGTCALRGKNLIEGNRIVGAGVFGYCSDCLPVSPYMSRTICITYVVYFKIKHCSGPAVPNSVSKNLWVLPKQHHIVILALSQTVLPQCQTLKIKCSSQFRSPLYKQLDLVDFLKNENSNVDINKGEIAQSHSVRRLILEFRTPWDHFSCQCLAGVSRMKMNFNSRVSKLENQESQVAA